MVATSYAQILKDIISRYAQHKPGHGRIEAFAVFDDQRQHYCLVDAGWNLGKRVHAMIFFARIVDGKVRLEWDGLHYGITDELIQAGVPEADIIHAWMEPCPPEGSKPHQRTEATPASH